VRRTGTIPLAATVDFLESTHTNALPQVDLPCNRGCRGRKLVIGLRSKIWILKLINDIGEEQDPAPALV